MFELKTVAALAGAVGASSMATAATPTSASTGSYALTPIQHWFFDLPLSQRGHWNLGLTLRTPVDTDPALLQECLAALVARHDVFRLRFVERTGVWATPIAAYAAPLFEPIDLSTIVADDTLAAEFERLRIRAQAPFDLEAGPLLRAVHAHCGNRPGRLFVGVHHLAADLLGLRIIAEDLGDAWRQRTQGAALPPPAGNTSWSRWTERLHAYAQGPEVGTARAHWMRLATLPPAPLPRDHPQAANRHDSTALWHTTLDATRTDALLAQAGGSNSVAGALLAALATALRKWSGHPHAWIDVEGHGRDPLADDVDVTRTVGWFTTLYPIVLAAATDAATAARQAAEALRAAPLHGLSFGLLRYLHRDPAVRAEVARLWQPEVTFLYQGRLQNETADQSPLPLLGIDADHGHAGDNVRSHLLEINAWIAKGSLRVDWTYSRAVHDQATVQRLALAFERALSALESTGSIPTSGTSPRVAPLSFAQERIWFLHQLDADATVYNKQAVLELGGPLNRSALHDALAELIARHETLRTRFEIRDGAPVQLIDPPAIPALRWIELDGAGPEQAEAAARARAARCFDLAACTPFEAALLRLAPERHWLVLTLHHIVTDAWSLQVLIGELARLYSARLHGTSDPLPPLSTSFADFAQWQRQWLSGATLDGLLGYWTRQLDALTPLDLPTDRPRPPIQRFDGGRVTFSWPVPLTSALRQLGRTAGASQFMSLLSLYMLLLHRYTGQTDIVVGAPAADRPRVETENLIGPLVNNLVLRADLSGEPDFRTLLARVRETVLAANEHRDLPFEKLVEALNPTRDRSRSPLFQVMFAYMNVPGAAGEWSGLRAHARELEAGGAEFDLSLYAYAPGNRPDSQLTGWFEYSTALFERSTIERLAAHLQQLAVAACAEPARSIAKLPMLTAPELRCVIDEWNRTSVDHEAVTSVQRLFERQVQRNPDAAAAMFDDATMSYVELDRRANRLARHLRSLGIAPDDRVAICVERTSAMLVALLAILKAGGAYVPIDPTYPANRIAHMVKDSGARVVLTLTRWLECVPAGGAITICLDRDAAAFETLDSSPIPSVTRPEHLAYVVYTSGSTGKPKGVQIEHGAVVNFVQAMMARPGLAPGDTLLAVTTISFDIHVLELFVPLAVGACVVVASHDTAADALRLRGLLDDGGISAMQATPSTWRTLLDAGWTGTPGLKLLCGGEALAPDLAKALLPRCAELWNLYGPTEATVWATLARVTEADGPITIGRPFDNMRAYLLDPHEQPLPVGIPGELWLGGRGVARGYLNQPDLTAERFRPNPFVAGERIYRTGDRARWRADGCIELLGRLDSQVKLRGHRVELAEIEASVGAHHALAQCVCLVREDRPGDQRLVVYAIARGAARPDLAELREAASRELPGYMLPSALVWVERFPLTANGKVDRRALPAPTQSAAGTRSGTPLGPTEQFFAAIFADVLGVDAVGRYDNFFDLGGHSLLVMKVVGRVEKSSGIRMHPGELFQQTVGQIAAFYDPRLQPGGPAADAMVERIEPFFFEGAAGPLYGCRHVPDAASSGRAALLCAPTGHEYLRCHRALRQLAAQLARRGMHVLRFDYFGSGDSGGDADALRLAQCRQDIAAAIDELRRQSGATRVALVGLRLGATLAWQAATLRTDVDRLVLWHPIVDGAALLDEWRADQREFATALGYRSGETKEQILGVPMPRELADEIGALTLEETVSPATQILIAHGADARQSAAILAARGRHSGCVVDLLNLADNPIWRQESLEALVPSGALCSIVDWLDSRT